MSVWAAWDGPNRLYMQTYAGSAKVKRIRNYPEVGLTPCDARGNPKGQRQTATARPLEPAESGKPDQLLAHRYGWARNLIGLLLWLSRRHQKTYLQLDLKP